MKLKLSYRVVAGTDRGGEDVSLHVELVDEVHPHLHAVEEEALAAYADWRAARLAEYGEGGEPLRGEDLLIDGDPEGGVVLTSDGFVRTFGSEYGFRVNVAEEALKRDLALLARDGLTYDLSRPLEGQAQTPEWRHGLRSGLYRLEADLYEHGNAD